MATTTYNNIGPIYLTQSAYESKLNLGQIETGREYRIISNVDFNIPDAPSDFAISTYVLKFVNGTATWVKES